jgi:hypothetical protein
MLHFSKSSLVLLSWIQLCSTLLKSALVALFWEQLGSYQPNSAWLYSTEVSLALLSKTQLCCTFLRTMLTYAQQIQAEFSWEDPSCSQKSAARLTSQLSRAKLNSAEKSHAALRKVQQFCLMLSRARWLAVKFSYQRKVAHTCIGCFSVLNSHKKLETCEKKELIKKKSIWNAVSDVYMWEKNQKQNRAV